MKKYALVSSLAFAAAITLVSTGCRHQPVGITHIPGAQTPEVSEMPPGGTLPSGDSGVSGNPMSPTAIATTGSWDLANYDQDRAALAADSLHFAYDSAVIRDSDHANLQAVAQALAADPGAKLVIEGNCDERGTEEYNRSLGERRALAAREALAAMGVDPSRVRTISYGKDKPVDTGHDAAAWAKNRNDTFVLCHPKSGA